MNTPQESAVHGDPSKTNARRIEVIVVGVDAHSQTHTAAAAEAKTAREIANLTVVAREHGHAELLAWARGLDADRVWAIEDARNLSGGLERFLLAKGEHVLRVPPKLMAKERKTIRSFGKSDPIDALAVARAAISNPDLPEARVPGPERELRLIADHRDDLVEESTRYQRRLRWLLHDLDPELAPNSRGLSSPQTLERLSRRLARMEQTTQVAICRELCRRIRELQRRIRELQAELAVLVRRECPQLMEIPGLGVLTAARILADVGDVSRFANERKFASYAGVAPLDASSGRQRRHRLNPAGNRRLNRSLYMVAITQARIHGPARDYMARKRSEGKSGREAIRALKRLIARRVYRILVAAQKQREEPSSLVLPGAPPTACLT